MKIFPRLCGLFSYPAAYRLAQRWVGADYARKIFLAEYAKPAPGEKILDIGCGPGDILNYLPKVNYSGLDLSPEYIRAAQERFGSKGRFCCADVGLATIEGEQGTFDLVLAIGVLHHLDELQAGQLFALARRALSPGGRLVTYDGCYSPGQSFVARWFLDRDRGKFVRTKDQYLHLASACFSTVHPDLRHDLLRIPYTHLIMRCSGELAAGPMGSG
ncbi:MAG TPA: class I SAM-dependent methyltransferase [Verrucomicrobiae bacterium]|nr:class I SAM-dependent methyltransferase [Verrucomicrobiae bacterium]